MLIRGDNAVERSAHEGLAIRTWRHAKSLFETATEVGAAAEPHAKCNFSDGTIELRDVQHLLGTATQPSLPDIIAEGAPKAVLKMAMQRS